jgi:L-idonate 5-dehydrogenase
VGCGPIGALAVGVLKRSGAAEIVAVDVHDKPLAIARAVGATRTLDATDPDATGGVDADVVIECSGNPRGLATAVRAATRGGRVVMVGLLPPGEQPALISLAIAKELELVGSFRFNDEIDAVLAALADGSLAVDPVVTHEFPAADALAAFAMAQDASQSGRVLLDFS